MSYCHPFTGDGECCAHQPAVPSGLNVTGLVFVPCGESRANHAPDEHGHAVRYEIKPALPQQPAGPRFYVRATTDEPGRYRVIAAFVPEAEANIIAFALNKIAEGKHLAATTNGLLALTGEMYDGPTEGVAP